MLPLECVGRIPVRSLIVSVLLRFCHNVRVTGYATKQ